MKSILDTCTQWVPTHLDVFWTLSPFYWTSFLGMSSISVQLVNSEIFEKFSSDPLEMIISSDGCLLKPLPVFNVSGLDPMSYYWICLGIKQVGNDMWVQRSAFACNLSISGTLTRMVDGKRRRTCMGIWKPRQLLKLFRTRINGNWVRSWWANRSGSRKSTWPTIEIRRKLTPWVFWKSIPLIHKFPDSTDVWQKVRSRAEYLPNGSRRKCLRSTEILKSVHRVHLSYPLQEQEYGKVEENKDWWKRESAGWWVTMGCEIINSTASYQVRSGFEFCRIKLTLFPTSL